MGVGGVQALIGSFGARLGLDTGDYARGIINAQGLNAVFGQSFATFISNPLLGSIQIFKQAGQAALGWANDALNAAQQASVLARQLNASTDLVQALKAQYEGLGQAWESAVPSLVKLVQAVDQAKRGTGPAAEELDRYGISLRNVTNLDEALETLIDGLSRIEDPTTRLAVAQRVLGEQGAKVLAVIGDQAGSLGRVIDYYRQLGLVIDNDTLRANNALKDQLGEIEQAMQGVQRAASSAFLRGFSQEVLGGAANVEGLTSAINSRIVPAAERLGRQTGELVGDLDKIIDRVNTILDKVDRFDRTWVGQGITSGLGDVLSGDAFEWETLQGLDVWTSEAVFGRGAGNARRQYWTGENLRAAGARR